jgi:hypothetical protein
MGSRIVYQLRYRNTKSTRETSMLLHKKVKKDKFNIGKL